MEGLNLSEGIVMEPLSRNQRNGEGLNLSEGIGLEPLSRNQRNGKGLNFSELIGMKRVTGGEEDDSVVKKVRLFEEFDKSFGSHKYTDENVALEKVKVDEHLDGKGQVMVFEKLDGSIGHIGKVDIFKWGGIKNGAVCAGEFNVGCHEGGLLSVPEESHDAIQVLNGNLRDANGGSELGFDLNIPVLEVGDGSTLVGLLNYTQRTVELNENWSDASDRREERLNKGKVKQIEEIMPPYDAFGNCKLELGVMNIDQDNGGSIRLGCEKRYTREEKGTWLSLATLPVELDLQHEQQQQEAVSTVPQLGSVQHRQNVDVLPIENVEVRKNLIAEHASRQAIALRERASRFARYDAPCEGSLVGLLNYTQRTVELNENWSDASDRREERLNKGKVKQIEEIMPPYDAFGNCKLELGVMNIDQDNGGSIRLGCEKRYTREEKGTWLSLATLPVELDLQHEQQQQEAVSTVPQLGSVQHRQNVDVLPIENVEVRKNLIAEHASRQAIALRERASRFARYDAPCEGSLVGLLNYTQRTVELNENWSDASDRREERLNKGKVKQIEEIMPPYDAFGNCKLELGVMNIDQDNGGSIRLGCEKRYTREEKGTWLSLATLPVELDLQHEQQQQEAVSTVPQLGSVQHRQNVDVLPIENVEVRKNLIAEHASRQAIALRERASRFARYDAPREGSFCQEKKLPTLETIKDLRDNSSPFSTALKRIRERIPKRKDEKLVKWEASQHPENKEFPFVIPSLLDLSLKTLSENAEAIVSLQGVPDILRRRLTELLCNSRKMSCHMLDLLVQGSPTQIRIKDCSWLTEKQFCNSFNDFDRRNLMVLQLDLCGQPALDCVLGTTIAPASNSLPNLAILSLRGACQMSDRALETLVTSAPSLQSIDLGQCSLLTHTSIDIAANSLGSILKELCIDDCQSIDAMLILPALEKMEHLELLSVAGIDSVCDQFVSKLLTARGQNLKELDISGCQNLTDQSLKFIGDACANLHSLNISNLSELTDVGLQFLANGCRSIEKLIFCRNSFSDEGIAAFLEVSGACLQELSLNSCSKVSTSTAFSLAKRSIKLLRLDLSWCRRISDEELGLIVDSCLSLKLLKLFGCTQITDVFLNGHSNTIVQIIGLSMTPIFDKISRFDGTDVQLKY